MDNWKQHHQVFIRQEFRPDCDKAEFTQTEWDRLLRFGAWFEALDTGELKAETQDQHQFVHVVHGGSRPLTDDQRLWLKYKALVKAAIMEARAAFMDAIRQSINDLGENGVLSSEAQKCVFDKFFGIANLSVGQLLSVIYAIANEVGLQYPIAPEDPEDPQADKDAENQFREKIIKELRAQGRYMMRE